ncbi:hypothetical protein GCM10009582_34960 [Arthrobacter flavus]
MLVSGYPPIYGRVAVMFTDSTKAWNQGQNVVQNENENENEAIDHEGTLART